MILSPMRTENEKKALVNSVPDRLDPILEPTGYPTHSVSGPKRHPACLGFGFAVGLPVHLWGRAGDPIRLGCPAVGNPSRRRASTAGLLLGGYVRATLCDPPRAALQLPNEEICPYRGRAGDVGFAVAAAGLATE
jgi:hypothetical protein